MRQGGFVDARSSLDLAQTWRNSLAAGNGSPGCCWRWELHDVQGDYAKALEFNQEGLKLSEEIGDKAGIANSLSQIGNVHLRQARYSEASSVFDRSLSVAQDVGDRATIARVLHSIGLVHMQQEHHSQALEYYVRSLKYFEELANEPAIAEAMNGIGLRRRRSGRLAGRRHLWPFPADDDGTYWPAGVC